jgi:uncharacterized membrane protein
LKEKIIDDNLVNNPPNILYALYNTTNKSKNEESLSPYVLIFFVSNDLWYKHLVHGVPLHKMTSPQYNINQNTNHVTTHHYYVVSLSSLAPQQHNFGTGLG